jgi:hypothetical protein
MPACEAAGKEAEAAAPIRAETPAESAGRTRSGATACKKP